MRSFVNAKTTIRAQAGFFAVQATEAVIQVFAQPGAGIDLPARQRGGQGNAAARRFRFIPVQRIGRAYRQAQAALHTLIGQLDEAAMGGAGRGLFKRHAGHAIIASSQPAGRWACAMIDGSAIISRP